MHEAIRNYLEGIVNQLEKNESIIETYNRDIDRLRIENEEIKKVISELRLIK